MSFFEDIGSKITQKSSEVAAKTKDMMDVSNLNTQINKMNREILQCYQELGDKYYQNHKADMSCELWTEISAINEKFQAIAEMQEKIETIKAESAKAQAQPQPQKFCTNCGAELTGEGLFCTVCGTKADN